MKRVYSNNWFIDKNQIGAVFSQFIVELCPFDVDGYRIIEQKIVDTNGQTIFLLFDSLEEAFSFTEDCILEANDLEEIYSIYMKKRKTRIM